MTDNTSIFPVYHLLQLDIEVYVKVILASAQGRLEINIDSELLNIKDICSKFGIPVQSMAIYGVTHDGKQIPHVGIYDSIEILKDRFVEITLQPATVPRHFSPLIS